MSIVQRIEFAGPDRKARRLSFSEGAERITSAAAMKALGIVEGMDIDLDELSAVEMTVARERALWLVGYRERSERELRRRLADDGYPADCVGQIVDRFAELQLVDDARFARLWARTRVSAGFGASRIRRELANKGVAADVVSEVLAEMEEGGTEAERARDFLRGKVPANERERQRLIRRLVTRGFPLGVALGVVPKVNRSASSDTDSGESVEESE